MVGNLDRKIFINLVVIEFDMFIEDVLEFWFKMLCGYVISKSYNIFRNIVK